MSHSVSSAPPESEQERTAGLFSEQETADFRKALRRVLDSPAFSGSHRLSDFLAYVGEAALVGRRELDQYEIAENVLHKNGDFNPLDDATVRKLASQIRHKLDDYYEREGTEDTVQLSLPRRTYVPRFRYRSETAETTLEKAAGEAELSGEAPAKQSAGSASGFGEAFSRLRLARVLWVAAPAAAVLLLIAALDATWGPDRGGTHPDPLASFRIPPTIIDTTRGDLRGPLLDVAPGAVQLGPLVGDGEEAIGRMKFVPEQAIQQAGMMILESPDRFVRLGQHFKIRPMMEFAYETQGQYHDPEALYKFDPLGQLGMPRWFSIRRQGSSYAGFLSADGFHWQRFGKDLEMADPMNEARLGIYAFNGRTDIASARASFDNLGVGISFHDRPDGPLQMADFPGWTASTPCPDFVSTQVRNGVLEVDYADAALGCNWELTRKPPQTANWTVTALIDFAATSGSGANLIVRGSKGWMNISRRDLNGGSIRLQRKDDEDVSVPDFPGSPPLFLRVALRDGKFSASFSRDGSRFREIPYQVEAASLGELHSVGVGTSTAHWTTPGAKSPVLIYRIYQEMDHPLPLAEAIKARPSTPPASSAH